MFNLKVKIVRKDFRQLSKRAQEAARRRNIELAKEEERIAKQLVPVDTGALKASIHVEEGGSEARVVAGNEQVDYAPYVEYGTRHEAAQPFMTPAAEQVKKKARNQKIKLY